MLHATTDAIPTSPHRSPVLAGAWLVLGTTLALAGALRIPQVAPIFLVASVVGFVVLYARDAPFRRWADALPMRAVIAAHALRLPIGAAFLWEASRGHLHPLFAHRAGGGDVAVGALAILVALFAWRRRPAVRVFGCVGLIDILIAAGTMMYVLFALRDPLTLSAITRVPYAMLPLVVVPVVILTHLLMLRRKSVTLPAS